MQFFENLGRLRLWGGLDYYPFGMLMPGRAYNDTSFRFGFNGQEKDNEIQGVGNTSTAAFWEYDSRLGRRWNLDPQPQFNISGYAAFNNAPTYFTDGKGNVVTVHVGNEAMGYTKINLYTNAELKENPKLHQMKVTVPVYEVTVTNESGHSSNFLFTRNALKADIKKGNRIEDRTFDVKSSGAEYVGKVKFRKELKSNVLELRTKNNSQIIEGMEGDVVKDRQAIQFHVLGASEGCLMCVGENNLLKGSQASSSYPSSRSAQDAFINTVQSDAKEDKENGYADNIVVKFNRLHDNPSYNQQKTGNSDNKQTKPSKPASKPPPIDDSINGSSGPNGPSGK